MMVIKNIYKNICTTVREKDLVVTIGADMKVS